MNDERQIRLVGYKNRIIACFLVMTLCFSSIVGSTYALFTSDPERGKIGVNTTSGTVKADIVDTSNEENSLVGKTLQFVFTSQSDTYYFEPGATIYTQGFRVKNMGNVTMNFRLYVSNDPSLEMSDFSDAFDVFVVTSLGDIGNVEKEIASFVGRLEAQHTSDEEFHLVIRMKESASNYFQGRHFDRIGITVYAIQGNVDIKE